MPLNTFYHIALVSTTVLIFQPQAQADSCIQYAQQSVAQQEENLLHLCGFRGSQWSDNLRHWQHECQHMSQKDRDSRLNMRQHFLEKCPHLDHSTLGRNRQHKLLFGLLEAIKQQNIQLVRSLLNAGTNLGAYPTWLTTSPLVLAIKQNNLPLARLLIKHGAKPYLMLEGELNPLSLLLKEEHTNHIFLEYLLQHQANPNLAAKGVTAEYPLVIAAAKGDTRSVDLLLKYQANANLYIERPALQLAVEQDHYPITRALIKHGANPNLGIDGKVCQGNMALDIAFRSAKDRVIDLLLDHHALAQDECQRHR